MNTNMIGLRCFPKIFVLWMNVASALEGLKHVENELGSADLLYYI